MEVWKAENEGQYQHDQYSRTSVKYIIHELHLTSAVVTSNPHVFAARNVTEHLVIGSSPVSSCGQHRISIADNLNPRTDPGNRRYIQPPHFVRMIFFIAKSVGYSREKRKQRTRLPKEEITAAAVSLVSRSLSGCKLKAQEPCIPSAVIPNSNFNHRNLGCVVISI